MHKRVISRFSVVNFSSHTAKKFYREPFNVSENLGYRKILCMKGRYHQFPSKIFSLTVPKYFVKEPFCVQKVSGTEKTMDERWGVSRFSIGNFLSHSAEKLRGGTFLCFRKFLVSKNFMDKNGGREGVSQFSIENLLSHSTEKFRRGTLLCFGKFLVSKRSMDRRGGGRECHDSKS